MSMTQAEAARKWLVQTALSHLGTPYIWGGDDPSGFDCSGFVLECLKTVGVIDERSDLTADSLMRNLKGAVVDTPTEGALLFTLDSTGRSIHVVICLDEWYQIGASGGTSATTENALAWRNNAFVKIRPIRFRPDKHRILLPEYEKHDNAADVRDCIPSDVKCG